MTDPRASSPETDAHLAALILDGAAQLGIDLDPERVDRLVAYLRLIDRWNSTYNLTAIRGLSAMATQHVVDSLAAIPTLRTLLSPVGGDRIIDVGSGAGLPGVVMAIVEKATSVVCVDSVGKKAAFLTHVAGTLGLGNLSGFHARVEEMRSPSQFDIVVSRAFSSLADLISSTRHLLRPAGRWMAMKGKVPHQEMTDAVALGVHMQVRNIIVPGLAAERCLIVAHDISESERQL